MTASEPPGTIPPSQIIAAGVAGAIGMAAAMGFGRFSYTPILPGMMAGAGLSASDAGLIASANFIGYLVGAVAAAYGWAAGRERRIALGALAANALLLAAMAASSSLVAFIVIRFLAGLVSAFAMIFLSGMVLSLGVRMANPHIQSAHFGGVGIGIALSSLMVWLVPGSGLSGFSDWRAEWLAGAAISALGLAVVWLLLPKQDARAVKVAPEPKLVWTRPLVVLTISYGIFGFGYIITATFLVAMARQGQADPIIEFLAWFVTGIAAAASVYFWSRSVRWLGLLGVYICGLFVEAAGVLATVALPLPIAPLFGGLLLGATFIMITAFGLQIGRRLAPESPRRALALMTAAFGLGQIIGPVVAGLIAESTGTFTVPTLLAAFALVFCGLLALAGRPEIEASIK